MAAIPDPVKGVIARFAEKYPIVPGEDNCRNWTHKLCQQLVFSFPNEGWGHKGTPHSKDTIALKPLGSSLYVGWDVILGAGTANPALNLNAESTDLTGQYFEPVESINWIGDTPPPPPPDDLDKRVTQLEQDVRELQAACRAAGAALAGIGPGQRVDV